MLSYKTNTGLHKTKKCACQANWNETKSNPTAGQGPRASIHVKKKLKNLCQSLHFIFHYAVCDWLEEVGVWEKSWEVAPGGLQDVQFARLLYDG